MLTMFLTFVKVGLFSFGGGYAVLAMLQQEIVVKHGWLTAGEFTDVVAISPISPGPLRQFTPWCPIDRGLKPQ